MTDHKPTQGSAQDGRDSEARELRPGAWMEAQTTFVSPDAESTLRDAVARTIEVIERQLDLIGERAPGEMLDKRPVVQSLKTHVRRLRAALARPAQESGPVAAKRLIGWRTSDYLMETSDPEMAKNWQTHYDMLPIFEGDPHTKLAAPEALGAARRMKVTGTT